MRFLQQRTTCLRATMVARSLPLQRLRPSCRRLSWFVFPGLGPARLDMDAISYSRDLEATTRAILRVFSADTNSMFAKRCLGFSQYNAVIMSRSSSPRFCDEELLFIHGLMRSRPVVPVCEGYWHEGENSYL